MPAAYRILLTALACFCAACVPAEYRSESDFSQGAETEKPYIQPLAGLLAEPEPDLEQEADATDTPTAQETLIARNEALASRAEDILGRPSSVQAPNERELRDRTEALRDRASTLRARQY